MSKQINADAFLLILFIHPFSILPALVRVPRRPEPIAVRLQGKSRRALRYTFNLFLGHVTQNNLYLKSLFPIEINGNATNPFQPLNRFFMRKLTLTARRRLG